MNLKSIETLDTAVVKLIEETGPEAIEAIKSITPEVLEDMVLSQIIGHFAYGGLSFIALLGVIGCFILAMLYQPKEPPQGVSRELIVDYNNSLANCGVCQIILFPIGLALLVISGYQLIAGATIYFAPMNYLLERLTGV